MLEKKNFLVEWDKSFKLCDKKKFSCVKKIKLCKKKL